MLGRETLFFGVTSESQLQTSMRSKDDNPRPVAPERRYPILFSLSEVVRPARLVVPVGATVHIGRDPKSELWLGAPHISRQHCQVTLSKTGSLVITDCSTNGTAYDEGLLQKGDSLDLLGKPRVLDFGGGVTVAICFRSEDEQLFTDSGGAVKTFIHEPPEMASEAPAEQTLSRRIPPSSGSRVYRTREIRPGLREQCLQLLGSFSAASWPRKILILLWLMAAIVVALVAGNLLMGLLD
jgi:hypothetical protein